MIRAVFSVLKVFLFGWLLVGVVACGEGGSSQGLFERRSSEHTGITFSNQLTPSAKLNVSTWPYFYNGAGVAVGDVNGDGLMDLYFTANQGPNRLYLNRGGFQFEDVTEVAGVAGSADWTNGVTMTDVNGDGRVDLYVSVVHGYAGLEGHNQLYINQGSDEDGIPQFEERAAAYGLDFRGYGIQSLFFDYDGDGDLDVYLLNGLGNRPRRLPPSDLRRRTHNRIGDRLYRNDDSTFVNVSDQAGIYSGPTGAGLGVVASDLDRNGCPDLYVANDFFEHDYLYYNNCDGTFTESIWTATRHVSYSSMGVDAADYNNDGRIDVAVLDMLPAREDILKTSEPSDDEQTYRARRRYGYHHQLDRNTLQLNRGNRRFSEIGLLAGVAATDWSWAPLFADLDNDGWKDLFVTNGIYRRLNDLDYFEYALKKGRLDELEAGDTEPYEELRKRMPQDPVPNYAFHNEGDLTFSDSTDAWIPTADETGFSNGAAYVDLNNDGALDLVVNNVNAPASVYENRADSLRDNHYLTIRFKGEGANTQGLGATVTVYQENRTQLFEQRVTRGYQSSVDPRLHVGLGTQRIDSLTVAWPDGRTESRKTVTPDQTIMLRQAEATTDESSSEESSEHEPLVTTTSAETIGIDFRHEENMSYNDLRREPLMPRKLSTEGPALAVGDVNGDGLDDVYLGGATRQPGALFVQQSDGQFRRTQQNEEVWRADRQHEDVDAAFFDADGNGTLDLYVASGGNQFSESHEAIRDRLYLNDGSGTFRRAEDALPDEVAANGAAVAPADFDDDGDVDLFVGSRVVTRRYGETPTSYLLENDGNGSFVDVTDRVAPALRRAGMVTDAVWTDVRGSAALDLVVVGEWMPITVFEQQEGTLVNRTEAAGLAHTSGWWNRLRAADVNGDGTDELIAGNFGRNSRLQATPEAPVHLYLNDFNEDGHSEPILTRYNNGTSYLWARRDELLPHFSFLKEKFPTYESFGARQIRDIFPASKIQQSTVKEARTFASMYVETDPDSTFTAEPLPTRAQFSPVYGILARDLDDDGARDLMVGGNFYGVTPKQGRYDASYGTVLRGNDQGGWEPVPSPQSNLYLRGEVRALRHLRRADGSSLILVARNNDRPLVVRLMHAGKRPALPE